MRRSQSHSGSDMQSEVADLVVPIAVHSCLHRSLDHTEGALRILTLWPTFQLRRIGWVLRREGPQALHCEDAHNILWTDCYNPEQAQLFWQDSHTLAKRMCSSQYQRGLVFLRLIVQISRVCKHWYGLSASWIDINGPLTTGERQEGDPQHTELPPLPDPCLSTWPLQLQLVNMRGNHIFHWRRAFLAELPLPHQLHGRYRLALQISHRLRFPSPTSCLWKRPSPLEWDFVHYTSAQRVLRGIPDDVGEIQWRWSWCEQEHRKHVVAVKDAAVFELIFQDSTAIPEFFRYQDRHQMPMRAEQ